MVHLLRAKPSQAKSSQVKSSSTYLSLLIICKTPFPVITSCATFGLGKRVTEDSTAEAVTDKTKATLFYATQRLAQKETEYPEDTGIKVVRKINEAAKYDKILARFKS